MTEPTATPAPVQTGLTIQDLLLVLQVVQVATSRGAFKADELSAIGNLYDRLFKFLESSGAITKDAPATPPKNEPKKAESKPAKPTPVKKITKGKK